MPTQDVLAPPPMAGKTPPVLDMDPYAEDVLLDPYPFHAALRDAGPVVWIPKYETYAVGRYADIKTIESDWERFTNSAGIGLIDKLDPESHKLRTTSPLTENDPPTHTAIRAGVQKLLSPLVVRSWRTRFEEEAARIVDQLITEGKPFNAVARVSEDFVLKVFPESLGLDVPREYLPLISELNFFSLGPMNDLRRASMARAQEAIAFYDASVLRQNIRPGTFGEVIYKAEDAGIFEPGVGAGLIHTFLRGGTDTTVAGLSATLLQLALHPEAWAAVRADTGKMAVAFEEAIRLESPSQNNYRLTSHDMIYEGYALKGGVKIAFYPGSANRDPRAWDQPAEYRLDRDIMGKHLAFGVGPHVCIGQMIARLEAVTMLQAIAARVDRLDLTGTPRWRAVSALRSLEDLPMAFGID